MTSGNSELELIRHRLDTLVGLRTGRPFTDAECREYEGLGKREIELLAILRGSEQLVARS